MNKVVFFTLAVLIIIFGVSFFLSSNKNSFPVSVEKTFTNVKEKIESFHPLSIQSLRNMEFTGNDLVIEETLPQGSNYNRYIASYTSDGLKQYGLLTVPTAEAPKGGFPAIVFNHGYISPAEYKTTERYIAYTDAFSRNGYVLFRPDYRGHDKSEGRPEGAYGSNAYTIDVLNALTFLKKYKDVNPDKIGMWGHSMGGFITLRAMVVRKDIKAGVIWAGVVASHTDLINKWRRNGTPTPFPTTSNRGRWRSGLIAENGTPEKNPAFWSSLSANSYLEDVSGPIQLHHGTADTSVPVEFSEKLEKDLKEKGKTVELYVYDGDDHNIANNFNIAIQRSVEFFDTYLK